MLTVFAHEAHDSARVSHAHIPLSSCPCHPKLCELGTHSGCRRGAELVYPLFNVLLTDKFPSQEKGQVHPDDLCLVSTWRGCVQGARCCSPQPSRCFEGNHVAPLLSRSAAQVPLCRGRRCSQQRLLLFPLPAWHRVALRLE